MCQYLKCTPHLHLVHSIAYIININQMNEELVMAFNNANALQIQLQSQSQSQLLQKAPADLITTVGIFLLILAVIILLKKVRI